MSFTKGEILANWDTEGLEVVEDLALRHGYERLPDPVNGERLEDWMRRCAGLGLLHLEPGEGHGPGAARDLRNVLARQRAEELDLPVYRIGDEAESEQDAEVEYLEETSNQLRSFNPDARFVEYVKRRAEILLGPQDAADEEN